MSDFLPLCGRILLALVFLVSGSIKLSAIAGTAAYFGRLGLPAPTAVAWVVALFELIGGLLIVVGFKTRWVAVALILFTAVATYMGHKFWAVPPDQFTNQLNHALKNLALMGGFLLLAAYGPGRLSVDARRGAAGY
jgi:putative oxidoreductase